MMHFFRALNWYLVTLFGLNLKVLYQTVIGFPKFISDLFWFLRKFDLSRTKFHFKPCIGEHLVTSGVNSGEYFYQDLLAAQLIFSNTPELHLDIGSRIDGFVLGVASFRKLTVLDIRKNGVENKNIDFVVGDITSKSLSLIAKYDSVSCLHTLEHIGLGRYGDEIDAASYLIALKNISNILKSGGRLYLSVPVGMEAIYFNSNRVFSLEKIVDELKSYYLELDSFFVINSNSFYSIPVADLDVRKFKDFKYLLCLLVLKKNA
jgi:SAM-dependent methyltransferase